MKTTKKAVFDFIENHDHTIFVYVCMKNITSENSLQELLTAKEADIIAGKIGIKRKVIQKTSTKIIFENNSSLYKTDKYDNNYTFKTGLLTWYVFELAINEEHTMFKYMCYAAEN